MAATEVDEHGARLDVAIDASPSQRREHRIEAALAVRAVGIRSHGPIVAGRRISPAGDESESRSTVAGSVVFRAAEAGALKAVVPRAQLPAAITAMEARGSAVLLIGPPLGGAFQEERECVRGTRAFGRDELNPEAGLTGDKVLPPVSCGLVR